MPAREARASTAAELNKLVVAGTSLPTQETYAPAAAPAAAVSEPGDSDAPKTARGRETSAALKTAKERNDHHGLGMGKLLSKR